MPGPHPLARFALLLALTAAGAIPLSAVGGEAPDPAPAAAGPAERDAVQIVASLTNARALKKAQPELFGGAEGVQVYLVAPDGQAAAAGIAPGDVLIGYRDTPLDSVQQLVALIGATPAEDTLTLRWLRPGAGGGAEVREAPIGGGRIGVVVWDIAETPAARKGVLGAVATWIWNRLPATAQMSSLADDGGAAHNRGRYWEAMGQYLQGLALADREGDDRWRGRFLRLIGDALLDLGRYHEVLEHQRQALDIARETDDRFGEGGATTASATFTIASVATPRPWSTTPRPLSFSARSARARTRG